MKKTKSIDKKDYQIFLKGIRQLMKDLNASALNADEFREEWMLNTVFGDLRVTVFNLEETSYSVYGRFTQYSLALRNRLGVDANCKWNTQYFPPFDKPPHDITPEDVIDDVKRRLEKILK